MSKLFYDHLVVLEELEVHINSHDTTKAEKKELWDIVDNLIQLRVMDTILTALPKEHHDEFLGKFTDFPHDEKLLEFVKEKTKDTAFEKRLEKEIKMIEAEILGKKGK